MKICLNKYSNISFVLAVLVLSTSAVIHLVFKDKINAAFVKEPIPLKSKLDYLDISAIDPYSFLSSSKLDAETEETLDTTDYIQWKLEDTSVSKDSPVRYCDLFITYYTGLSDQIPHVPDECYLAGGYQVEDKETTTIMIDSNESNPVDLLKLPIRYLTFTKQASNVLSSGHPFTVIYFFKMNGSFAAGRAQGRALASENIWGKYSYFSKVEWKFSDLNNIGASKDDSFNASRKLLDIIVPLLEKNHWPDWNKTPSM